MWNLEIDLTNELKKVVEQTFNLQLQYYYFYYSSTIFNFQSLRSTLKESQNIPKCL